MNTIHALLPEPSPPLEIALRGPLLLLALLAAPGCAATSVEDAEEVAYLVASLDRGEAMTGQLIELSTNVPLSGDEATAAEEIAAFIQEELDCVEVTQEGPNVSVVFGDESGGCPYYGRIWTGLLEIQLLTLYEGDAYASQEWTRIADEEDALALDGRASVRWSEDDCRVVHDAAWTTPDSLIEVYGEREQELVDPALGLSGGVRATGRRDWLVKGATWSMTLDGIETLVRDAVPQAGTYGVTLPDGRSSVDLNFQRVDKETIRMSVTGARKDLSYEIDSEGSLIPL